MTLPENQPKPKAGMHFCEHSTAIMAVDAPSGTDNMLGMT
jgi:hypothetical protein